LPFDALFIHQYVGAVVGTAAALSLAVDWIRVEVEAQEDADDGVCDGSGVGGCEGNAVGAGVGNVGEAVGYEVGNFE
jgi:hypothetical protein